jgi:hypothetical protein
LWFPLVPLAILNGIMREAWLVPMLGYRFALPLSGVSLSVLIFLFTLVVSPWFRASTKAHYAAVGKTWLLMTVLFEFLFGYYVMGESLTRMLEAYNVLKGNLWALVLVSTAASPYLAARVRRLL